MADKNFWGHWLRRLIHVLMGLIPIFYYWYGKPIALLLHLSPELFVCYLVMLILMIEFVRLWSGLVVIGQRYYEMKQVSALAWGSFAIGIVLLTAPKIGVQGAGIGLPLIWSLSFVDPILGEARYFTKTFWHLLLIGLSITSLIWLIAIYWLGTPGWLALFCIPLALLGEFIKVPWIDDNALILFFPLAAVLALRPFI